MKCHMVSFIPHPEAFVHIFLQVVDIILQIGQNKNTLGRERHPLSSVYSIAEICENSKDRDPLKSPATDVRGTMQFAKTARTATH